MMGEPAQLWRRRGLLLPAGKAPAWASHAQLPTILVISDQLWRVYFAARDAGNRSRVLAIDVDPSDGMRIVEEHFEPLLDLGPVGGFDHEGVLPAAAVKVGRQVWLYYIGAAVRRDVRAVSAIGLAVSNDGLNFRRAVPGPVVGTGPFDPFFTMAPHVTQCRGGFRMWYVGGTAWKQIGEIVDPFYEIRVTSSPDGCCWDRNSKTALGLRDGDGGLGRPWTFQSHSGLRLCYSRRGVAYRGPGCDAYRLEHIALEESGLCFGSPEPIIFENPPEPGDFDDWMQAYACIQPQGPRLVMVYNGNHFGRGGIGWATLDV